MKENIVVINDTTFMPDIACLQSAFNEIIRHQKVDADAIVSLVFVGETRSQELNSMYRGKDYPTDVLSFSQGDSAGDFPVSGEDDTVSLGDIIICTEVMVRQAHEKQHSTEKECLILFIHGVFHLLGYDHEVEEEAEIMEGLEKEILISVMS